jgi:hypothetical protein
MNDRNIIRTILAVGLAAECIFSLAVCKEKGKEFTAAAIILSDTIIIALIISDIIKDWRAHGKDRS